MGKAPTVFETTFESYSVRSIIGSGGSGQVFAATDSAGASVAIKCLSPGVSSSSKRKRFKNEIEFCIKQHHKSIVPVLDHGVVKWNNEQVPFYVMPQYASTLAKAINEGIPAGDVLPLFSQVLDGLEAAHLLGVTHRDLKPENILCDAAKSQLVIADFGIADFAEELMHTLLETKPGERLANFVYAAPEQRRRDGQVDKRADIFALGLILNEMFTGNVPHGQNYPTIAARAPEYSFLDTMVAKMIQNDPKARPATIQEVKIDLLARKQNFVILQQLEQKRLEVIPASTPTPVDEVVPMAHDWNQGGLRLTLNRVPEPGWVQYFSQLGNYSCLMGLEPHRFSFRGSSVSIGARDAGFAQEAIHKFKEYSATTTSGYRQRLKEEADRNKIIQQQQFERELKAEEERQRINASLRV